MNKLTDKVLFHPNGCWIWTGARKPSGYGNLYFRRRYDSAHRVSYVLHKGEIPNGKVVLHSCDRPCCVNPEHLSLGSQMDNFKDMVAKGRARGAAAGSEHTPMRKLCREQVAEIRALRSQGMKLLPLANKFGVCEATISYLCSGVTWK